MDQERIWAHFQEEGVATFAGAASRLRFLVRRLGRSMRVLNVGIGDGGLERLAVASGRTVSSLDPVEAAALRLQALVPEVDARVGSITDAPFADASFDAVVLSEVLEHLEDAEGDEALAEIVRILRPGGLLLGTVPHQEDLATNGVVCPCCGQRFHRWGHVRSFDAARLQDLLGQHFPRVNVRVRTFVPWNTLNWKGRLGGVAVALLARAGVHGTNAKLVFEARTGGGT